MKYSQSTNEDNGNETGSKVAFGFILVGLSAVFLTMIRYFLIVFSIANVNVFIFLLPAQTAVLSPPL